MIFKFRKKQKLLSFVLIFSMVLTMFTGIVTYGDEALEKSVSIRIEGINDTIINEKDYKTGKETVYEAVYELLSNEGIPMVSSEGYFSSINNEDAASFNGWDGWLCVVNGTIPDVGMADYHITDDDKIMIFYGEYPPGTLIPKVELSQGTVEAGDDFSIVISSTYFDWNEGEDVTTAIDGVKTEFAGETYFSDENGEATLTAPVDPGVYKLKISKVREDGCPLIVRDSIDISVTDELILDAKKHLTKSLNHIYGGLQNPAYGSEWNIMTLARGNQSVSEDYYEGYYNNIVKKLIEKSGGLGGYAEYSKVILALTAIGKDITNVGGYNLLEKLADYNKITAQGVIGVSYALLALDSHDYGIPIINGLDKQATREDLIGFILDKEIKKGTADAGGWALSGTIPDVDITANVLQALAPYYNDDTDVKAAIDRAIIRLSSVQTDTGGFPASQWAPASSESISQAIVALTGLKENPDTDSRFIKSDRTLIDALLAFAVSGGGFKHVADETKINAMATTQGTYALVAYDRFVNGQNSLYDMTDVVIDKNNSGSGGDNGNGNDNGGSSGTGGSGGGTKKYVTLSIDKLTINEGQVLKPTTVELKNNDTVWSLTKREMDKRDISYEYGGTENIYIQSIDGVGEFDHGPISGWMYSVNGKYSTDGANQYKLKDGDKLKWSYSTNLGEDLGEDNSKWEGSGGGGGGSPSATQQNTDKADAGSADGKIKNTEENAEIEIDLKEAYADADNISIWAADAIIRATQRGFISGSDKKLNPKSNVTRAEFTKIMALVLGLDIDADKGINFADINEGDWFYPYVNAAYKAKIIEGYGNKFSPSDTITREQIAVIIGRALKLSAVKSDVEIKDMDNVSVWARADVETVVTLGLIVGNDNMFAPGSPATKEMATVVAMRVYDYLNGNKK
ncbi:MAG: DUF4430 domain-containing protein [Clostridiales bacterium]|nr:DUF4430 domain-containing protein [Clostridiales bacterium]